jgi:hypothetical protein
MGLLTGMHAAAVSKPVSRRDCEDFSAETIRGIPRNANIASGAEGPGARSISRSNKEHTVRRRSRVTALTCRTGAAFDPDRITNARDDNSSEVMDDEWEVVGAGT